MTNLQIRLALESGQAVSLRLHGNSMTPRIHSGDLVTIEPLSGEIKKGDIVFCKVRGQYYLHLVTGLKPDQVQISNNHSHVNGWTSKANVFGRLISVKS